MQNFKNRDQLDFLTLSRTDTYKSISLPDFQSRERIHYEALK